MATGDTIGVWNGARREMEDDGWAIVRALRGGTKAMRKARTTYTPATDTEGRYPSRYERRIKRSVLYPAYADRVASLASLPFQREPTIDGELPEPLDRILADADRCGTSLASFGQKIYEDAIDRGLGMFLVDNVPTDGMNLLEADEVDARPYFARIAPDNLVGFQTSPLHGRDIVTQLRYREWLWRPGTDGIDRLVDRVIVWDEANVAIWEKQTQEQFIDRDTKAGSQGSSDHVLVSLRPHGFQNGIPLVVVYTDKVATMQAKPALLALAYLNVAHWESTSIQGDALAYSRSPILKISGASHELAEQRPSTGPGSTVVDTSSEFEMSFVEIAGTSLAAGEREIQMLSLQMEALGMRPMVAAQGPETATGEVRADMSEKSQAQSWVEALEWALYQGFEKAAMWLNAPLPEDFDITLFKDSSLIAGKATDLPVLQQMAQNRMLSLATYLREVKARGVLVTVDDIDAEVEAVALEGERAVERQMEAMASRMIGEREGPDDSEEAEEPEAQPESSRNRGGNNDSGGIEVSLNELTLGVERLRRAGNVEGANKLLGQLADMLGEKSLGKVTAPSGNGA